MTSRAVPARRRIQWRPLLVLGVTCVVGACGSRSSGWVTVKSGDGKCSIDFPVTPHETTQPAPLPGGGSATIHALSIARKDGREYTLLWSDYPAAIMARTTPERVLENIRNGYEKDGSKILTDTRTTVSGNPARDLEVDVGKGLIHRVRLLMVGPRLYQIMTYTPAASRSDPDLARFTDSFHLIRT